MYVIRLYEDAHKVMPLAIYVFDSEREALEEVGKLGYKDVRPNRRMRGHDIYDNGALVGDVTPSRHNHEVK